MPKSYLEVPERRCSSPRNYLNDDISGNAAPVALPEGVLSASDACPRHLPSAIRLTSSPLIDLYPRWIQPHTASWDEADLNDQVAVIDDVVGLVAFKPNRAVR